MHALFLIIIFNMNDLSIKRGGDVWQGGIAKEITFIVTKDCQLACKYCYLVGKNTQERMSWETAKKAIDYILDNEYESNFNFDSVVWDFIGGEPFLEIDLIDKICDYSNYNMLTLEDIDELINFALLLNPKIFLFLYRPSFSRKEYLFH